MKGVIFKQFESFVTENFGAVAYEEILDETDISHDEPFLGPETYPDDDLYALVGTAVKKLGVPVNDAIFAFGKFLYKGLASSLEELRVDAPNLKELLMSIHSVIHIEVKKFLPGADTPEFSYVDKAPDRLVLRYQSARGLCSLAHGLIEGAAEAYSEGVSITKTSCTQQGAPYCEFDITFLGALKKAS